MPVALDGERLGPVALVEKLNRVAGAHGVGRLDLVENRLVGIKSRGVYETPAGTVLHVAHRELERLVLDRNTFHFKQTVSVRYAQLIYDGLWFSTLREALAAFVDETEKEVTGEVRVRLFKGRAEGVGRRSPRSLYRQDLATFGEGMAYDHQDAEGFIRLFGLPERVRALTRDRDPVAGAAKSRSRPHEGRSREHHGPLGFRAAAVLAGIKPDRLDLALVVADRSCPAAGVFTTNRSQAAPVLVSREHLQSGLRPCGRGQRGLCERRDRGARARGRTRDGVVSATALGCRSQEVLVASTGVIGVHLPMDKIRAAIPVAAAALSREAAQDAARAIMTTDTKPKEVTVEFEVAGKPARIGGMAKGAGMIAPNMATLLAFFTTDAAVSPMVLRRALLEAVGEGLNRITVDGDTSTNDMAVVLASGAAETPVIAGPGRDYDAFRDALTQASRALAEMIVRDGEGASRIAEIRVEGARSAAEADRVARTIAESPLVKTALHGGDPNWGRILAAAGRSGVEIDPDRVGIWIGEVWVAENGQARAYNEDKAHAAMLADPVRIRVHLGQGTGFGWMWTCDLTHGYVDINAHYRS